MKRFRPIAVFLLCVIISTLLLSLLLPTRQQVEKTILINAPVAAVYDYLVKLENFHDWSVWGKGDSSVRYSYTGTEGTVGAASDWKGDPFISGEGSIRIRSLEPGRSIAHDFTFSTPKRAKGSSEIRLEDRGGQTLVTWHFEMPTPRPWNIFNLFYNMDKEMGKDFEQGLIALKEINEKKAGYTPARTYEVMTMDFPATRFAMIRQVVKWNDLNAFYGQHIRLLQDASVRKQVSPGTPSALYFIWDEKNQQTDMAAALPVPAGSSLQDPIIRMEDVPASKALYVDYYGHYNNLQEAHLSLDKYMAEKKLVQKTPVIEQYILGPGNEKDTSKWLTKIVYLVD